MPPKRNFSSNFYFFFGVIVKIDINYDYNYAWSRKVEQCGGLKCIVQKGKSPLQVLIT